MQLLTSPGIIPEKYTELKNKIQNGDLILYHGTGFLAKAIEYFDSATYNHVGVVWKPEDVDRILTMDMWSDGLDCLPLSRRMEGYADFCILRPKVKSEIIQSAIQSAIEQWDGRDIKYNFFLLLRIAIIKKTGIDVTGLGSKNRFICSQFAQFYTNLLGLSTYTNIKLITPEDFRRYIDENFELIYDTAPKPNMSFVKKIVWNLCGNNYTL